MDFLRLHRRNRKPGASRLVFFYYIVLLCTSCAENRQEGEVHVHDRHVHSYDIVKSYTQSHGPCTLVLMDYHHDVHPGQDMLTSVNWAGRLLEEGAVSDILWLSGRTLLPQQRSARMAWLGQSLADTYPDIADYIKSRIRLCDWQDLRHLPLKKPFVVTIDFDIFTKDTDSVPDQFADELRGWIQRQKPELLTLCLSAAYQPDAEAAWQRLERFIAGYRRKSRWYLEGDVFGAELESLEEYRAWKRWREQPELFQSYGYAFHPGAYLWLLCPPAVQQALLQKGTEGSDGPSRSIIASWRLPARRELCRAYPAGMLAALAGQAAEALQSVWRGEAYRQAVQPLPVNDAESRGIAVRFKTADRDRGCLALYGGYTEAALADAIPYCAQEAAHDPRYPSIRMEEKDGLFTNICVFAPWQQMDSPTDFLPGQDSLLLEDEETGERTLLQTAIAIEYGYTREAFLSRLSRKAGLGTDGWRRDGLRFYKSVTLSYTAPFSRQLRP